MGYGWPVDWTLQPSRSHDSVQTSTSTFDVVRQLLSLSQTQDLSYDITDRFHLKDGRLPFDNSGILLEKVQLSGAPSPLAFTFETQTE